MKKNHPINAFRTQLLKKNQGIDKNLLAEIERLRREANLSQPKPEFRLTPPLGGAIPTLKLYNN
jgi:hypothetical protein